MSQNLQNFVKFQKFQLENLVDFEKCCQTHIYLQKSEPIQPKTSNILPKICRSAVVSPTGGRAGPMARSNTSAFGLHATDAELEVHPGFSSAGNVTVFGCINEKRQHQRNTSESCELSTVRHDRVSTEEPLILIHFTELRNIV